MIPSITDGVWGLIITGWIVSIIVGVFILGFLNDCAPPDETLPWKITRYFAYTLLGLAGQILLILLVKGLMVVFTFLVFG